MYISIIYRAASLFSVDLHVAFAVFGVICGFLLENVFYILYGYPDKKYKASVILLLVVSFLLYPHVNINGVRLWTATWV